MRLLGPGGCVSEGATELDWASDEKSWRESGSPQGPPGCGVQVKGGHLSLRSLQ